MNWKYTEKELPITYKEGYWDGKKSDEILVQDEDGNNYIAVLYSGFMDVFEFNNWYSSNDEYELGDIVRWMNIPD